MGAEVLVLATMMGAEVLAVVATMVDVEVLAVVAGTEVLAVAVATMMGTEVLATEQMCALFAQFGVV